MFASLACWIHRGPSRTRHQPLVATVLIALIATIASGQSDWQQWRGPQGSGVAEDCVLPTKWSQSSSNLNWRTEIPGHGISSPIVSNGRVFLTTAYRVSGRSYATRICDTIVVALVLLLFAWTLWKRPWRKDARKQNRRGRLLFDLEQSVVVATITVALVLNVLIALGPDTIDAGLETLRSIGIFLLRGIGRDGTHLDFLDWGPTNRPLIWLASTGVALLTLSAAVGLQRNRLVRFIGVAIVWLGILLSGVFAPFKEGQHFLLAPAIAYYSPAALVSAYFLLSTLLQRVVLSVEAVESKTVAPHLVLVTIALAGFVGTNLLGEVSNISRDVVCIDEASGDILWQTVAFRGPGECKYPKNSYATPTPCTDGYHLIAYFGTELLCLDFDGEIQWRQREPDWAAKSINGAGSSPIIYRDRVMISSDREYQSNRPSSLRCFALATGDMLWESASESAGNGYSTPVIDENSSQPKIISLSQHSILAFNVADGRELWRVPVNAAQPVPSMLVRNNQLLFSGGINGRGETGLILLGENAPTVVWKKRGSAPEVSSPVWYDDLMFTVTNAGVMSCYDVTCGKRHWRKRLPAGSGDYFASLVAADGKVYACQTNGTTAVVLASSRFRLVAENDLGEETWASPAVHNNRLFLRTAKALYCFEESEDITAFPRGSKDISGLAAAVSIRQSPPKR